jgi:predicted TIM-barrel fold metal-dependent hydrolase
VPEKSKHEHEYPWIVSADDHVVEPPSVWWDRLSLRDREVGPRVVQDTCTTTQDPYTMTTKYLKGGEGPITDWWLFEDRAMTVPTVVACVGLPLESHTERPINYADMRAGCHEPQARLADMDLNHTERSLCFPYITRFCGQLFHEAKDKDLAMKCVLAYNDWMIDEWCGSSGGRLIPLCLIPLWDPPAAAEEIRRNAGRGCRAITFPEMPSYLGLPSIHDPSRFWEPVFDACSETGTVLCMHIGSGSRLVECSPFAPKAVIITMKYNMAQLSMVEWLCSGLLARYPRLKIVYSESQIGWMPYILERLDKVYTHETYADFPAIMTEPPSTYVPDRVFGSFFDDETGVQNREAIGVGQLLFEIDYPHQDTTWPNTHLVVEQMAKLVSAEELKKIVRTNALRMLGLPDDRIAE